MRLSVIIFSLFFTVISWANSFTELKEIADAYFNVSNYDLAIVKYKEALKKEQAIIYSNIGQCYRQKKDNLTALEYFDKALLMDNTHLEALYWSIKLRMDEGVSDPEKIKSLFALAEEKHPQEMQFRSLHAEFKKLIAKDLPIWCVGLKYTF